MDRAYMSLALRLARQGRGRTHPNPMVGAVLAKNGEVVAAAFHRAAGEDHAEALALRTAAGKAAGSTLYVNLEPCVHQGKTPPCVPQLVRAQVARVVVAMKDPNPLVSGRGIAALRQAGIQVEVGLCEQEAQELNEGFVKHITTGCPFTTMKAAISVDGKIATARGESRWISGEKSRRRTHRLRAESDAIMVGVGTVRKDDPLLSARTGGRTNKRQPLKVVVDSACDTAPGARVLSADSPGKTLIAATSEAPGEKVQALRDRGADVVLLPPKNGRVDLRALMQDLGQRGIVSLLVEGGAQLAGALIRDQLVDKLVLFIAPKIIGGQDALSLIGGKGCEDLREAVRITRMEVRHSGEDLMLCGYLEYPSKSEGPEERDTCSPA